MTSVIVVPKEVVTVQYINVVQINVVGVNLGVSATINVTLFGPSGQSVVKSDQIMITGDDYKKWADNDDYVIDYVLKYYDLTPSP